MKKAFTMIELVFVIVILGILVGIATPKLMTTRDDAKITVLKSLIQDIRKGIEAYAGDQLIMKGAKKYPEGLCTNLAGETSSCKNTMNVPGHFFAAVLSTPVKFGSNKGDWNGWTNGVIHETFIYYVNNKKQGYVFEYNKDVGTFKCLNSYGSAKTLPCSDLGE